MANKRKDLTNEIYQDKIISCRKCGKVIGEQRLDGQILILAGGLIVFNYLCWKCDCNRASSWLAPVLPGEKIDDAPDIADIQTRALTLKEKAKKLGYRPKQSGYQPNQTNQPQTTDF